MIALAKRTTRVPSAVSTRNVLGEVNWPSPLTTVTLRCRARPVRPVVRRLTTPSFHPRMAVEIDRRRAEAHAVAGQRRRLVDGLGDMQQRLGGNAADVEADAAERRPRVDQHDFLPEIGGAERRGVAAGAGAENQEVGLEVGGSRRGGRGRRRAARRRAPRPASRSAAGIGREQAPWLTLSPTLTWISPITPSSGAGTSSVALSLSSVRIVASFCTPVRARRGFR